MITLVFEGKETTFDSDKELLDHVVETHSDIIPSEVLESIKNGLTVYNEDEDQVEELEEETGMDSWDGVSLVHWLSDDHDIFVKNSC